MAKRPGPRPLGLLPHSSTGPGPEAPVLEPHLLAQLHPGATLDPVAQDSLHLEPS